LRQAGSAVRWSSRAGSPARPPSQARAGLRSWWCRTETERATARWPRRPSRWEA